MAKHFSLTLEENHFAYQRQQASIDREAALDGIYVLRTNVSPAVLSSIQTVHQYKNLSAVERAFRSLKSVDLKVRPIHHRLAGRVRTHIFLCMLAYYVEWHMRQALAPILFDDHAPDAGEALRKSVVAPAQRSPQALDKTRRKRTPEGHPVHSFHTLLEDLRTIASNQIRMTGTTTIQMITAPTPLQQRAFHLLQVPCRA
jgi:hypothetical protein